MTTTKKEVYTIIEKRPGDLPHESHSAAGLFEIYEEAKLFLDEWFAKDRAIGRTHSVTSVYL